MPWWEMIFWSVVFTTNWLHFEAIADFGGIKDKNNFWVPTVAASFKKSKGQGKVFK
jgi:hypothetical protein